MGEVMEARDTNPIREGCAELGSPSPRLRGEGRGEGAIPTGTTRGEPPSPGSLRDPTSPQRGEVKRAARRRDIAVAAACGVFVAFMVGMAYAAVPLYSWFCKTTGFGGVPQIASAGPAQILDRKITVRFDANVGAGLPWRFEPERTSMEVKLGEVVTVYYTVTNLSARETAGQAAYNVAPTTVGAYFAKINCFCFTEQRMAGGEKREMAVVFYVDPVLTQDSDQDDLNTITLSYTFFPLRPPRAGVAGSTTPAPAGSKI
jgi:cytochrome c oxidase assembly protein subunit 11